MVIKEYFKKEYARFLEVPKGKRLEFFWDYYKWPAIAVVLALVLLVQGVLSLVNYKETSLSAIILNCRLGVDSEPLIEDFFDFAGIDTSEYTAALYTDLALLEGNNKNNSTTYQRIMGGIAAKDTDFIAGKAEAFKLCAYSNGNIVGDLRNILSEDQLAQFADRLYYIDKAVLDQINAPLGEHVEPELLKYPDPHKPEVMEEPIPVGIDISDRTAFQQAFYLSETKIYLGIVPNTPHMELTLKFIDFLFA